MVGRGGYGRLANERTKSTRTVSVRNSRVSPFFQNASQVVLGRVSREEDTMPRLTITMDQEMLDAVELYAESWGQSLAGLVRLAVQALLDNPEDYHELLAETCGPIEDERTPA